MFSNGFLLKYICFKKCKNIKINSINSDSSNLHYIDWIGVNKKIFGSFGVGPKMGLFTLAWELIWSTFSWLQVLPRKRDWIDHLTFIIVQQTLQLTPHDNGLQVPVQIQSLPKIQILP